MINIEDMFHGARSLLVAAVLAASLPAHAQSQAMVASARELGKQGLVDYDAGRYDVAATKLEQAYAVVKVPSLAVYTARALAKTGKLVRAAELYLEATRLPTDPKWQQMQFDMQSAAATEREALLGRIPRLVLTLEGAEPSSVTLTMDGATVPSALLGMEQLIDPGKHRFSAKRGTEEVTAEAELNETDKKTVTLRFAKAPVVAPVPVPVPVEPKPPPPAAKPPPAPAPRPVPVAPLEEGSNSGTNTRRMVGWAAIGVGGAGLVVGSAAGLFALLKRSDLTDGDSCADNDCYPETADDVDTYNAGRTVSTIGFVVGGIATAAGITLLVTAPKSKGSGSALFIGPGSVHFTGGF